MQPFKRLMASLDIGNVRLPNRIVFPATVTKYASENGIDIISVSGGVAESRPRRDELMEKGNRGKIF